MAEWKCFMVETDGNTWTNPATGETGEMFHDLPVGAMWWHDHSPKQQGFSPSCKGGGKCLRVMTPEGPWAIDHPSYDGQNFGPGWTWTGEPPVVTVTPSINFPGRFHGWLKDGILSDC